MFNSFSDLKVLQKEKFLGEGAFSRVVKVMNKNDGNIYALKKVDINRISDEDLQNLNQEINLHKSIQHDNIIKFVDNI